MSTSRLTLLSDAAQSGLAGLQRVRGVWWSIVQTSLAAGLAWYITHDLLGHPQPFFAPIAAAVCLSATNVLRAQRAIQMMFGVTLGIGVGMLVVHLIGTGAVPIAVAALLALCVAVLIGRGFIGQGLMFVNQTTVSAILVLALYRSGVSLERIFDALVGGGLAIVFAVLLFPANPLTVLSGARSGVLEAVYDVLCRTTEYAAGRKPAPKDWPLSAVDRVHEQLGGLIGARTTARQIARGAPRRRGMRQAVYAADQQALYVALLAGSVMQLARAVAPVLHGPDWLPQPAHAVLADLGEATELADSDPALASAHVEAASRHAAALQSHAEEKTDVLLAGVVQACVDDLRRVIDLHEPP